MEAIKCKTQELSAAMRPAMWNWSSIKTNEANMQKAAENNVCSVLHLLC